VSVTGCWGSTKLEAAKLQRRPTGGGLTSAVLKCCCWCVQACSIADSAVVALVAVAVYVVRTHPVCRLCR
jgi:hypothetical protein